MPAPRGTGTADEVRPVLAALRARSGELVRREDGVEVPLGLRGARTRNRLLLAGFELLSEEGYQAASVAAIAARAGVSVGTFYQYFRDRSDLVAQLVNAGVARLMESEGMSWRARDGRPGLRRMIGAFTRSYAEQARFWSVWEEVTHNDEALAAVRRDLSRLLEETVERELRRARRSGAARPPGDPAATARALTAMVDRFCYLTYVFDPADPPMDPDAAADLLTGLWAGAVGLADG